MVGWEGHMRLVSGEEPCMIGEVERLCLVSGIGEGHNYLFGEGVKDTPRERREGHF